MFLGGGARGCAGSAESREEAKCATQPTPSGVTTALSSSGATPGGAASSREERMGRMTPGGGWLGSVRARTTVIDARVGGGGEGDTAARLTM